ncbi:hypothetical protein [Azospirillum sp. B506]|uniref:hypothetical protein n=1 Tax=Azospirillum sp. B506 TaxID=137721 RepID=UPI00034B5F44|nr:hypothetical protein [Azospirillum sp. B506]
MSRTQTTLSKALRITMPDGSRWDVPLEIIARSRAAHYADEFGDDAERSLAEDTAPLFDQDPDEAIEWASNNMNWSDVAAHAARSVPPRPLTDRDKQTGWMTGDKEIVELGG